MTDRKPDEATYRRFYGEIAEDLVAEGFVDLDIVSDAELWAKTFDARFPGTPLTPATGSPLNITGDLLKYARGHLGIFSPIFRCLFYAMWCEHQINRIITALLRRRGVADGAILETVRSVSIDGKLTWLAGLLGFGPLSGELVSRIRKLVDVRNAAVHHKWRPASPEIKAEIDAALESAPKIVEEITELETIHVFRSQRARIRLMLEQRDWPKITQVMNETFFK